LAQRAEACVVPIGICREGATHRVMVDEPLRLDPRADDAESARRCNEALEALVRRAPQEWTWFHNRCGGDLPPQRESD